MITANCIYCGKEFLTHACYSKRGGGKFCSLKCYRLNKRKTNPNMLPCEICGKLFYSKPYQRRLGRARFCSIKCRGKIYLRKIVDKKGYIFIYKPKHPLAHQNGYVHQSHLVMEQHLGRYLSKNEIVHHRNGNPSDNRIINLKLYKNHYDHSKNEYYFHQRNRKEHKPQGRRPQHKKT